MYNKRRAHYFHASANAFGGRLTTPFEQVLPVLAPSSLPSAGGYSSARHEGFRPGEFLSVEKAYTQVSGSSSPDGGATTLATSVIEGLNVGNIFFADRIAAQISIAHREGHYPSVSLLGTEFRGLRIGDCPIVPTFHLGLWNEGDHEPSHSPIENREFLAYAQRQNEAFEKFLEDLPHEKRQYHEWAEDYADTAANLPDEVAKRGSVRCSVVDTIQPGKTDCPWTRVGHAIHIPEFGRVFLGELIVGHSNFDLTMIRFDLGCPVTGTVSGAQVTAAGAAPVVATGKKKGSGGGTGSGP
jgi:hypothetical protein